VLGSIVAMIGQVIDAAGSVVGYRHGTEEPNHSVVKLTRDVQLRRYGARIATPASGVSPATFSARTMSARRSQ
jgi:hypothetical protein